jgi:protein gp37
VTPPKNVRALNRSCYAERFSERFRGVPGHPFHSGFDLTLRPERLERPQNWKRHRMIFVNSMSDLFHKDVPVPTKNLVRGGADAAMGYPLPGCSTS